MKTASAGLSVALTGVIFWINHNLGVLFWVLLVITLFDILYGAVLDMLGKKNQSIAWSKSLRGFSAMGLPVLVANFHTGLTTSSIYSGLQIVFAVLILAQLSYVIPALLTLLKSVSALAFGAKTQASLELDKLGEAELQKLATMLDAKLAKTGISTSSNVSQDIKTAMSEGSQK